MVRGTPASRSRLSAEVISDALCYWYHKFEQLPKGVSVHAPSVREWAARTGIALRKLVAWLTTCISNMFAVHDHRKLALQLNFLMLALWDPDRSSGNMTFGIPAEGGC